MLRDQHPGVARLDSRPFEQGQHKAYRLLRSERAFHVRRVLGNLAHEGLEPLDLFFGVYYQESTCQQLFNSSLLQFGPAMQGKEM